MVFKLLIQNDTGKPPYLLTQLLHIRIDHDFYVTFHAWHINYHHFAKDKNIAQRMYQTFQRD